MAIGDMGSAVAEHASGASVLRSDDDGQTWLQVLSFDSSASTYIQSPSGMPIPSQGSVPVEPVRFDVPAIVQSPTDPPVVYVGINQFVPVGRQWTVISHLLRTSSRPSRTGGRYDTWQELGIAEHGRLLDLALSVDGQYLFAATEHGFWRLPDPAHQPPL